MPVEGRDLGSRQTQDVGKDRRLGNLSTPSSDLVKLFVTPQLSRFFPIHQLFLKIIGTGISQV